MQSWIMSSAIPCRLYMKTCSLNFPLPVSSSVSYWVQVTQMLTSITWSHWIQKCTGTKWVFRKKIHISHQCTANRCQHQQASKGFDVLSEDPSSGNINNLLIAHSSHDSRNLLYLKDCPDVEDLTLNFTVVNNNLGESEVQLGCSFAHFKQFTLLFTALLLSNTKFSYFVLNRFQSIMVRWLS